MDMTTTRVAPTSTYGLTVICEFKMADEAVRNAVRKVLMEQLKVLSSSLLTEEYEIGFVSREYYNAYGVETERRSSRETLHL